MPMANCLQERCDAFVIDSGFTENHLLQLLSGQWWVRDPFSFGTTLLANPQQG